MAVKGGAASEGETVAAPGVAGAVAGPPGALFAYSCSSSLSTAEALDAPPENSPGESFSDWRNSPVLQVSSSRGRLAGRDRLSHAGCPL